MRMGINFLGYDQPVTETLVVSFQMIMPHKFGNPFAQRILAEPDHAIQAGFLDAADESFGIGIGMSLQMRRMATLKVDVSE